MVFKKLLMIIFIIQCVTCLNSILLRNHLKKSIGKEYKTDLMIKIYDQMSKDFNEQDHFEINKFLFLSIYAIFGLLLMGVAIILQRYEVRDSVD